MKRSRSAIFKGAAVLFLLVLALGAGAGFLEASRCGDALMSCLSDPFSSIIFTGVAYCVNGYYFCIRFIK